MGSSWIAARSRPRTSAPSTQPTLRTRRAAPPPASAETTNSAYAEASASVVNPVTGSPASACSATATITAAARRPDGAAARRSTVHSTHGITATDHARLGKFPVDTTTPEAANAIAPSRLPGREKRRAKNSHAPAAAAGHASATHRLKPSTSPPISRVTSAGGKNIWYSASATADCPPPTYGSQSGHSPPRTERWNQRWRPQKKRLRSRV